jgi:two-component system, NarL family, sensor histidine kinase UhpB
MDLRLKINLIVGALMVLFVTALLALQVKGMRASVHEEVQAANRVAAQLLNRSARSYGVQGTSSMQGFLQGVGRIRSNDITLFDAKGKEVYRSPPSPYKAGRDAPEWFARLLAPEPSVQAISFPDGGKLEVSANASRAVLDAWDEFAGIAWASLGLLLLVNTLVLWLVGRTVRPFAHIVGALNELEAGRFDVALPPLAGREAAAIGAAFNRMVARLRDNLDTERRAVRAERELTHSRELARWVDHHIEQERRAIARELHDELGQSVTAMRSLALSIAQRAPAPDAQTAQAAHLIADESSRLYDAMHGLIPRLAPMVLDSLGLEAALKDLAERTRAGHRGVQVDVRINLGAAALAADSALALYRAAQEGITNALRHGRAQRIELLLRAAADAVTLDLSDDGEGLADAAANHGEQDGHYGLRWLAERAEGLGGTLRLQRNSPRGAHLQMTLPLNPNPPPKEDLPLNANLPLKAASP